MAKDSKVISVRIPATLHQKLTEAASDNVRSLNSEMVNRLAASFERDAAKEAAWEASFDRALEDISNHFQITLGQHEMRIAALEAKLSKGDE